MLKRKPNPTEPAAPPLPKPIPMKKRSSMAAIDFEGAAVHVALASNGKIVRSARLPIDAPADKRDDAAAVAAALKAALESGKIKPKEAVFALPRAQVVLRPLQVPMVADVRELAAVVNFQIAKDLPFRVEDAIVDFKVLRGIETPRQPEDKAQGPEQRLEVLVGAVRRDVVEFYRAVAREAGLKLEGLGLRPTGNVRFARQDKSGPADAAVLVISLRTDETTVDVLQGEKLVFSRVVSVPFPEKPEAHAAFISGLPIEAVRALHSYGSSIAKILVLGGTGLEQAAGEALSAKLSAPFELLAPTDDPGGAAAAGLALAAIDASGLPLDFENPKRPPVQRNTKRVKVLVGLAAAFVLLFTLVGIRMNLVKKRVAIRQQVQQELADAEKKSPIYRRLRAQHKVVTGWMSEEKNWLDHIAYLSGVLPGADQIYVSAFTTTPQHVVRFSVQARSGELLAELDKKLRAAGYEVKPLSITPANDKHGYNFRTTVELTIPKKMKPDLAKVKAPPRPADDTPVRAETKAPRAGGARS